VFPKFARNCTSGGNKASNVKLVRSLDSFTSAAEAPQQLRHTTGLRFPCTLKLLPKLHREVIRYVVIIPVIFPLLLNSIFPFLLIIPICSPLPVPSLDQKAAKDWEKHGKRNKARLPPKHLLHLPSS
jgi:hypothetical protein